MNSIYTAYKQDYEFALINWYISVKKDVFQLEKCRSLHFHLIQVKEATFSIDLKSLLYRKFFVAKIMYHIYEKFTLPIKNVSNIVPEHTA